MQAFRFLMVMMLGVMLSGCGQAKAEKAGGPPAGFAVPVVGVKIQPQTVQEKVPVIGSLSANEAVEVKSKIDGAVKEIHFEEGQPVKKGDTLIVLDASKLKAILAEAEANLDIAKTTFGRMKLLVESGAVSKQEYDQAQSAVAAKSAQVDLIKAQWDETQIIAPFDGTAGERHVSLGQVIVKDTLLTVIIDGDPMKVDFHVPERYASRLKEEQVVELHVAAYPKEVFKGDVYFIDPQVNDTTRTILVKAKVANPDDQLRRGMFAKLDLIVDEKPNAVVVPEMALIPKGEEVFVFTVDAEGKAKMNQVKTGVRMPSSVEIISGLSIGDTVITEGFQKIGPGSPVKVLPPDALKEEGSPKSAGKGKTGS